MKVLDGKRQLLSLARFKSIALIVCVMLSPYKSRVVKLKLNPDFAGYFKRRGLVPLSGMPPPRFSMSLTSVHLLFPRLRCTRPSRVT